MQTTKLNIGERMMVSLMRGVAKLPLGFHYAMADFIGWLTGSVFRYRRDVVDINIARCFPELKYRELDNIRKGFYKHFGDVVVESVWMTGIVGEKGLKKMHKAKMFEITNVAELNRIFLNSPSMMILSSHLGSWELFGGFEAGGYDPENPMEIRQKDLVAVYKELHSKFWNHVFDGARHGPFSHVKDFDGYVESNMVLRFAIKNRDRRLAYMFYTDQYPYGKAARIELDFLNQKTECMIGGAALACKLGYSVVYMKWARPERGHYQVSFIPVCEDARTMTPEEIVKEYYRLLEENIKECPELYLWSHKRWK